MKTIADIKTDIKDIRYYYSKRKDFDNASKTFVESAVIKKAEIYSNVIKTAPAKLYDLYVAFVVNNNSQVIVAEDWGFCVEYIKNLCRKMYAYLLAEMNIETENT